MLEQLWLLAPSVPLRERLGGDFFQALPSCPGVYIMSGRPHPAREEGVLYVGKSINLRRRLRTYNRVRPGHGSRRLVRLVHRVTRITWEVCEDEERALLRENELIRLLRPPFNRANTWPQGYWFVGFRSFDAEGLQLCLQHEVVPEWEWYGAFRGSRGYIALARSLAWLDQRRRPAAGIPADWLRDRPPRFLELRLQRSLCGGSLVDVVRAVREFLDGTSDGFLGWLRNELESSRERSSFECQVQTMDLETLNQFWRTGTRRNLELRERFGLAGSWIPRETLDDLVIRHTARRHAVGGLTLPLPACS